MQLTSIPKLAVVAGAIPPLVCAPAHAQSNAYDCGWGPHMMGWSGGWFGMFFGPLMMVFVLVILMGAVVLVLRWSGVTSHGLGRPNKPIDILKERFARGEIDKDEFEQRRKLLGD